MWMWCSWLRTMVVRVSSYVDSSEVCSMFGGMAWMVELQRQSNHPVSVYLVIYHTRCILFDWIHKAFLLLRSGYWRMGMPCEWVGRETSMVYNSYSGVSQSSIALMPCCRNKCWCSPGSKTGSSWASIAQFRLMATDKRRKKKEQCGINTCVCVCAPLSPKMQPKDPPIIPANNIDSSIVHKVPHTIFPYRIQ